MSTLEEALQRALAVRLNLQVSLSQLPIVEEWMDIHLDRWLEHNPMPHEMPDGPGGLHYMAMVGSDLKRIWWGAWGHPAGFIPKMADYFKLCNIAKSDSRALDQIGAHLEPSLVGSWIGVWGGKVTTGWHFYDEHPWPKVEEMFGTHEAKFAIKKLVEDAKIDHISRFTQSIGEEPYTEIELPLPGSETDAQIQLASTAFAQLTGTPLPLAMIDRLRGADPALSVVVRVRAGKITRVGLLAPGPSVEDVEKLVTEAGLIVDPKLSKLAAGMGKRIERVEYGRAGERAGVDIYIEPGDPQVREAPTATPPSTPSSSVAN